MPPCTRRGPSSSRRAGLLVQKGTYAFRAGKIPSDCLEILELKVYFLNLMKADEAERQDGGARQIGSLDGRLEPNSSATSPVFMLPGLGGEDAPELEGFWGTFRDVLPVVMVSFYDWTDLARPGIDFHALVLHIKRQIESHRPTGPLRLAGYSMGGHLAYACALAFQAEGRQVERLVLLDAPADMEAFSPPLNDRLRERIGRLLSFELLPGLASLIAKFATTERGLPLLRRMTRFRKTRLPLNFHHYLHRKLTMQLLLRMFMPWWRTMAHPSPPFAAPSFLFRSEELQHFRDEDLGWSEYCLDLTVVRVAGSHHSMFDPRNSGPLRAAFLEAMTAQKL